MTDDPHLPSDEELSALLDGLGAPEAELTPEAAARLGDLRAAAALVATPVPALDAEAVDTLLASALAAADPAPVLTLPPRPRNQALFGNRWLVAAVVVAFLGIGLALVYSGTRPQGTAEFTAVGSSIQVEEADDLATSGAAAGDSAPAEGSATAVEPETSTEPASPGDVNLPIWVGEHPDAAALRTALAVEITEAPDAPAIAPTSAELERCSQLPRSLPDLGTVGEPLVNAFGTVDGETVLIFEFATEEDGVPGPTLVTAFGASSCDRILGFVR